jgi:hypothetical protein
MTSGNDSKDGPRAWWRLLFFGSFLGIGLFMILLPISLIDQTHAVKVWVDTEEPDAQFVMAAVHAEDVVQSGPLKQLWETGPFASGHTMRFPYTGIVLIGSSDALARLTRATVGMGERRVIFDLGQFKKEWTPWDGHLPKDAPPGAEARVYRTPLSPGGSFHELFDGAVNYEGDAALVHVLVHSPSLLFYAFCFVALLLLRALVASPGPEAPLLVRAVTGAGNMPPIAGMRAWPWLLAGAVVLIAAAALLESLHPYYFTQDDNFAQFLPHMLYGCDTLSAGVMPNWNPHQYLGAPLAEIGTYALTYPGTYLSYAIAVHGLGDRYATMEVFCWLHLLLGYFALFWMGRKLDLAAPLASGFALCQVLSGFALVCGRSWYYMTPVYLWAPLLFVALLHLRTRAPTLRWTIGTGLVIGLFFHAGNAQMWVYALGLAGIFALWSCLNRTMPWRRIVEVIPAGLVGVGLAAVLLVPQFLATRELKRVGGQGWDIGEGMLALFAPYPTPIVMASTNQRPYADPDYFGTLYYAGSVFTIAWLAGLIVVAIWRGAGRSVIRDPWNGLAVVTFILLMGKFGFLWTWQAQLPVLDQFNHPVKFLPFFHIFSCAAGALYVNRAIRLSPGPRVWECLTFLVIAGLMLYHAFWARSAFFIYHEQPYLTLSGDYAILGPDAAPPARILPLTFMRSGSKDLVVGLQHNFPTLYGISSIGGYDPLIEQGAYYGKVMTEFQTDPRATMRKHGVTHLVLHREVVEALKKRDWAWDDWRWLPSSLNALVVDCEHARPVKETEFVLIYEVKGSTPIAYAVNNVSQPLPVRPAPSGVEVDVSSLKMDGEVALNFLWRPGIRVDADGISQSVSADGDQHIRTLVRAGTKRLELRYESPWLAGMQLGGILVTLGLLGWVAMNAVSKSWRTSAPV